MMLGPNAPEDALCLYGSNAQVPDLSGYPIGLFWCPLAYSEGMRQISVGLCGSNQWLPSGLAFL
jgi:hypothetical protein